MDDFEFRVLVIIVGAVFMICCGVVTCVKLLAEYRNEKSRSDLQTQINDLKRELEELKQNDKSC